MCGWLVIRWASTQWDDDMTQNESAENSESKGARPNISFSGSGGLSVAIWKQGNDAGIDHYSVKLERRYKDAKGDFQSTDSLREGDVLRAVKLLGQADDWIEQDRTKQRSSAVQER